MCRTKQAAVLGVGGRPRHDAVRLHCLQSCFLCSADITLHLTQALLILKTQKLCLNNIYIAHKINVSIYLKTETSLIKTFPIVSRTGPI